MMLLFTFLFALLFLHADLLDFFFLIVVLVSSFDLEKHLVLTFELVVYLDGSDGLWGWIHLGELE